jgi:hypothetical protein
LRPTAASLNRLPDRPEAVPARRARQLALFSAVLLIVSVIGHRQGLVETLPFLWLLAIVACLALLAIFLAVLGLERLWKHGERAGRQSLLALLFAAAVLAPFAASGWRLAHYPPLTEVATDAADPPRLAAAAGRPAGSFDAARVRLQVEAYPELTGRRYPLPVDVVFGLAEDLVAKRGWQLARSARPPLAGGETTIQAMARTYLMGFRNDVAIRLRDEGSSTYVDMRSASRIGRHDLGDNAMRIERFLADLDRAVSEYAVADVGE